MTKQFCCNRHSLSTFRVASKQRIDCINFIQFMNNNKHFYLNTCQGERFHVFISLSFSPISPLFTRVFTREDLSPNSRTRKKFGRLLFKDASITQAVERLMRFTRANIIWQIILIFLSMKSSILHSDCTILDCSFDGNNFKTMIRQYCEFMLKIL